MVTGTSGTPSHSAALTVTINQSKLLRGRSLPLAFVTASLQRVDNQMTCLSYLVVVPTSLTHSLNKFVVEEG
jgi:hypothetical protein